MAPRALQKALQPTKRKPTRANATRRGHNLTWHNPIRPLPTNQRLATTDQEAGSAVHSPVHRVGRTGRLNWCAAGPLSEETRTPANPPADPPPRSVGNETNKPWRVRHHVLD